jgi:hypothetical protein
MSKRTFSCKSLVFQLVMALIVAFLLAVPFSLLLHGCDDKHDLHGETDDEFSSWGEAWCNSTSEFTEKYESRDVCVRYIQSGHEQLMKNRWCNSSDTRSKIEDGDGPCDCEWTPVWWQVHPLPTFFLKLMAGVDVFLFLCVLRVALMKQRFFAELGIAGVPNTGSGHIARFQVAQSECESKEVDRPPVWENVLEARLGRELRKKKLLTVTFKPRCSCLKPGKQEMLHICEDYVHLETHHGQNWMQKMMCKAWCKGAEEQETDNYYVLLRDTGYTEVIEHSHIAAVVARWCIVLAILCGIVDVLLVWGSVTPDANPSSMGPVARSTTRFGYVLLPLAALVAYWIGTKKSAGYIHIGVRPGGTDRGAANRSATRTPLGRLLQHSCVGAPDGSLCSLSLLTSTSLNHAPTL